jgi:threonine dehydratase
MVTPQVEAPDIARELGLDKLYFKREDLHPYGSHKGRSIPAMIDMKAAEGAKDFAISSSGNAALAALRHIQKRNAGVVPGKKGEKDFLTLSILVGPHMNPEKRKALESELYDEHVRIVDSPRPLQSLFNLVKGTKTESLRQSTDPLALVGYKELAAEIAGTPDLSAVFVGTSSGTTAEALSDFFIEHKKDIQVHIVQTTSLSPLAKAFRTEEGAEETSIADAIIDRVVHRRLSVENAVKKTAGSGWIARNDDIRRAQGLLREKAGIEATPNGALGFAGLLRALDAGEKFPGAVVCIVTGK